MPWSVTKDEEACSASKPWVVKNKDTGKVMGCHATEADAKKQQSALYAQTEDAAAVAAVERMRVVRSATVSVPAAPLPILTTVPNVPLYEVGMEFPASTGPVTFTFEDLASSVAARSDPTVPRPRIKLGHTDPRYNDPKYDAVPNFGFVDNMRTVGDGHIIEADLVGVPVWLANIMPVAYPSRSIEGWFGYHANSGREYQFIVTALALLGVCFPGVMSLADLPLLYGDEQPSFVTIQEGGE